MIVVDTNAIAYLLIAGEHTESAQRVLKKDPEWASPLLWRSEFRNVLAMYLHKKMLIPTQARLLMEEAEALMKGREYQVPSRDVLDLAAESGCSAYDCEFIVLARHLHLPLVTSDKELLKIFPDTAISLKRFAAKK